MSALSACLSLCLSALLFPLSSASSELSDLQGNCQPGWLDGTAVSSGSSLGCIYLSNVAQTWMDSLLYCRTLQVANVTTTVGLASFNR